MLTFIAIAFLVANDPAMHVHPGTADASLSTESAWPFADDRKPALNQEASAGRGFPIFDPNDPNSQIDPNDPAVCECMDLVFVIDDTGSMADFTAAIQAEIAEIVETAWLRSGGDLRLSLVRFGATVHVDHVLTPDLVTVQTSIQSLQANTPGSLYESSDEALREVITQDSGCVDPCSPFPGFDAPFRPNCLNFVTFVGDEPPGGCGSVYDPNAFFDPNTISAPELIALDAAARSIRISSIFIENTAFYSAATAEQLRSIWQHYAVKTGGAYGEASTTSLGSEAIISSLSGCLDCDDDGVADFQAILAGTVSDCDLNGIPDSCDLDPTDPDLNGETSLDCNGNGVPDSCDANDCNGNGVPDDCDLMSGLSADTDSNLIPDECEAVVLFVDSDAVGSNHGTSWSDAYVDLQDALRIASTAGSAVSEVWVASGTYRPGSGSLDPSLSFNIPVGLSIYGGFVGDETDRAERDHVANPTILSGDLLGNDDPNLSVSNSENSTHVVVIASADPNTILLDGLIIERGNATAAGGTLGQGGGTWVVGSPTFRDCIIRENVASRGGGAHCRDGTALFENCTFSNNHATVVGGGFLNQAPGANAIFRNCNWENNSSAGNAGAAACLHGAQPRFEQCRFVGNVSVGRGGAIHSINGGGVSVSDCVFEANSSDLGGAVDIVTSGVPTTIRDSLFLRNQARIGGGLQVWDDNLVSVLRCSFVENTASQEGGGAANNNGGNATYLACSFQGNSATLNGGGVANLNVTSPYFANCTFSSGTAGANGGGVYSWNQCNVAYVNCTIADNIAPANAGVGHFWVGFTATLDNCIVRDNSSGTQVGGDGVFDIRYSNIEGGYAGTGNIDADPRFANPAAADYRLRPTSPCIDAGDNAALPPDTHDLDGDLDTAEPIPLDLGGLARQVDDTGVTDTGNPAGAPAIVDMGAYEHPGASSYVFVDDDAAGDPGPGDTSVSDPNEDGTSAHPFDSLQEAIAAAAPGATVIVRDGNYTGTGNHSVDTAGADLLIVTQSLGGAILDCGDGPNTPRRAFLFNSAETNSTVLDGLTIRNGNESLGGGLRFDGTASPLIRNCRIEDCAADDGGGVYVSAAAAPRFEWCTLIGNTADDDGAGAYLEGNGATVFRNCSFESNQAAGDGGGVYARDSANQATFDSCSFATNSASRGGGLADVSSANSDVHDCTFSGNDATDRGGAVFVQAASPTITASSITGNFANVGGGILAQFAGNATISDCDFVSNTAAADGGGLAVIHNSHPTVSDCTFTGNTSGDEGGAANFSGNGGGPVSGLVSNCTFTTNSAVEGGAIAFGNGATTQVVACTVTANTASASGGGLYSTAPITVSDCIVSANNAVSGGGVFLIGSQAQISRTSFSTNTATLGGGLHMWADDATISDCTFSDNTASDTGGGVVNNNGGNGHYMNCTFSGNSATADGGGMACINVSRPTLDTCTFTLNSANAGGGFYTENQGGPAIYTSTFRQNTADLGGGAYLSGSSVAPHIRDCSFEDNTARLGAGLIVWGEPDAVVEGSAFRLNAATEDGGGAMNINGGNTTFLNCEFSFNSASDDGGNVATSSISAPRFVNCLIVDGSSGDAGGGAFSSNQSNPAYINCTIAGNAAGRHNAIAHFGTGHTATLANCIVWANGGSPLGGGGDWAVSYSNIQGGFIGIGNIDRAPRFVSLAAGDYRLRWSSPCVDAGDNTALPGDSWDLDDDGNTIERIPWDIAGTPRVLDVLQAANSGNPASADSHVDLGAFELLNLKSFSQRPGMR